MCVEREGVRNRREFIQRYIIIVFYNNVIIKYDFVEYEFEMVIYIYIYMYICITKSVF